VRRFRNGSANEIFFAHTIRLSIVLFFLEYWVGIGITSKGKVT